MPAFRYVANNVHTKYGISKSPDVFDTLKNAMMFKIIKVSSTVIIVSANPML